MNEDGSFVVFANSKINSSLSDGCPQGIHLLRKKHANDIDSNHLLLKDIPLTSPFAAAKFVCGYNVSGNSAWKNKEGISLKELLENESV
jgi:hypothetical protein